MTDQDLLLLDKLGFIPGPGETEENFLDRVAVTKKKYELGNWIPEAHWDWVREYLVELFYVKPLYICAFYSNRNLAPWQGAAAWIEGRKLDSIQLREGLRKGQYLKLYAREEILAHEAVHGVRSAFDESRFEEFFAYMSSEKKYRRVLGPILRRPWEIWPFFIALLGGILWEPFYLFGAIWAACGFVRLIKDHFLLNRAAQNINRKINDAKRTRAVLFRLTDEEIVQLAKKKISIDLFAEKQTCLRWRVIRLYIRGKL